MEPADRPNLAVAADPPSDLALLTTAARLSVDLNIPFFEKPGLRSTRGVEMLLVATPTRLELRVLSGEKDMRGGNPVYVDLSKVDVTSPAGRRLKQPIAKALGLKKASDRLTVIDTTAGFGEDAWIMAALGCQVLTVERNKVMATLLRDGLLRATIEHPQIGARVSIVQTDSFHMLRRIARLESGEGAPADRPDELPEAMQHFLRPDVIYMDPMFPVPAKGRRAAERKPMRVLRRLVGDDGDAEQLLAVSLRVAGKRVVVKRPAKAPPLGLAALGKPTTAHKGSAMRYDVYAAAQRRG